MFVYVFISWTESNIYASNWTGKSYNHYTKFHRMTNENSHRMLYIFMETISVSTYYINIATYLTLFKCIFHTLQFTSCYFFNFTFGMFFNVHTCGPTSLPALQMKVLQHIRGILSCQVAVNYYPEQFLLYWYICMLLHCSGHMQSLGYIHIQINSVCLVNGNVGIPHPTNTIKFIMLAAIV